MKKILFLFLIITLISCGIDAVDKTKVVQFSETVLE